MTGDRRVFIAHAHADIDVYHEVAAHVCSVEGWEIVYIPRLDDWWRAAAREIARCHAFVMIDTPASRRSDSCQRELAHARKENRPLLMLDPQPLGEPGASIIRFLTAVANPQARSTRGSA